EAGTNSCRGVWAIEVSTRGLVTPAVRILVSTSFRRAAANGSRANVTAFPVEPEDPNEPAD
ncbi:MAG: hypothetical protein AAF745_14030, partial [Planctomycetota bacterium]